MRSVQVLEAGSQLEVSGPLRRPLLNAHEQSFRTGKERVQKQCTLRVYDKFKNHDVIIWVRVKIIFLIRCIVDI